MAFSRLVPIVAAALLAACSPTGCNMAPTGQANDPLGSPQPVRPEDVSDSAVRTIAFLGDSITAGLGLPSQQAYPHIVQQMFEAEGYGEVEVVNGGISGDTTAGGARRVDQLLGPSTTTLVVALGGNDALRGLSAGQTYDNLASIIDAGLASDVSVVLVGMEAPTNYGTDYQDAFRGAFLRLSRQYQGSITFVPFLLEGVAGNPALNQQDGIHPNEQGARVIAELLYPRLRDIVDRQSSAAR